ncbi:MAG: ABC transporter permease [Oscillospiraceae bacterium]|jgi:simple sugar transport system permease protein|nr:ABC transporter permease [Oscillospiraceae bacterium]
MSTFLNFLSAAILAGTPLLYGTLGELICEKAGNLNLGVEGMMWVGALAGFYAAITSQSAVLALLAAFASGAACAAFYAFLTVSVRANQNVAGLTLTTFGVGLSLVLGHRMASHTAPQLPHELKARLASWALPGGLSLNPLTLPALILCAAAALFYAKTRMGLHVRAVGENPGAADAAGIHVPLVKYVSIILGGGICGMGGAFMSLITANGSWQPSGIVNGFGWIAVALVIFVRWNPLLAVLGSFLFGAFRSMNYYIPNRMAAIPQAFYQMLPFVLTIVVLLATSGRKNARRAEPAALGGSYFREER